MEDYNEFQIKNMLYKMKKIKKKRKCNNIQKIELFEVLENIPNNDNHIPSSGKLNENSTYFPYNIFLKKPIKEGMFTNTPKEGEEKKEPEKKEPEKKSADPTVKETREKPIDENDPKWWDGLDEVKSELGDNEKGMADDLSKFINDIYVAVITFNCMIALTISTGKPKGPKYIKSNDVVNVELKKGKSLNNKPIVKGNSDMNDNDVDDANRIFIWICTLESLIAAYCYTSIWFYVIFYSYSENTTLNSIFDSLTRENLKGSSNPIIAFIFFFIEYAIIILDDIRWVLSHFIPKYISKFLSKPLCFVLLFIVIYNFNMKFISNFKDLLIDTIKRNMHTNLIIIALYFVVIGEYFNSFRPKQINMDNPIEKASLALDILNIYLTTNIVTLTIAFFKEILRFIIILVIDVPLGAFLFIAYFFWISIFTGLSKLFSSPMLTEIVTFIRSDSTYKGRDPCDLPRSYFEQLLFDIKNIFSDISMFMFSNLFYIVIALYSFYVLGSSSYINNDQAQQGVMISHIIILGFTLFAWFSTIGKYMVTNTGLRVLFIEPPFNDFINVYKYSNYFSITALFALIFFAIVFFIGIANTAFEIDKKNR